MLNLDRLRVLHAVAAAGSVVGAARSLHVTTSAVSQQVARLEREVDQPLVERYGRGIRLTPAGLRLSRAAGDLMAQVERIESDLAAHRDAVSGPVTVAAFATAARAFFPRVLRDLRERHARLCVSTHEQEPHEAVPALIRGDLDVAVVQDWPGAALTIPPALSRTDLVDDVFDLAVPADSHLAVPADSHLAVPADSRLAVATDARLAVAADARLAAGVALADLRAEEWIGWSGGQVCHDWLVRTLWADGGGPTPRHTASEHATQLALVAAGAGIALIPRLGRDPGPPSVRFVPVDPPPIRRVFALWRASTTDRPAIGAVLSALRAAA